ncbi:MAG: HAMP domain-containing histidine kinase [Bacteroidales bacterium]|nr:HAMP domain-containing histidine kinase [Bacteroidales bacterium]
MENTKPTHEELEHKIEGLESKFIQFKKKHVKLILKKEKEIQKLKENEKKLIECNATKDKFFSIIAHNLKSHFNVIIGFSNLLLLNNENNNEKEKRNYISNIANSAKKTYKLLENLLLWASSVRGKMPFEAEQISLKPLFKYIVDLHKETARAKKISISYFLVDNITVKADKNMLICILDNLITNALKFTNVNGKVILSANILENKAIIKIEDNGVGIDEETKNNIFRLSKNQSTKGTIGEKGTGLGLILCKEFVEKNAGEIWVDSELGKGSLFIFTLPLICNASIYPFLQVAKKSSLVKH